jgi:hypothetical protein
LNDFADLFGTTAERMPSECLSLIAAGDWTYAPLDAEARDGVLLDLLRPLYERFDGYCLPLDIVKAAL